MYTCIIQMKLYAKDILCSCWLLEIVDFIYVLYGDVSLKRSWQIPVILLTLSMYRINL